MTVAAGYENLEYFGRGPEENYIDRKTATDVGVYRSTVTDQFVSKYVKPQENGNHTDVRWTSLTDNDGNGILVAADGTVESSALHVKAENINPVSWTDYPYNNQTIRHSTEVPITLYPFLARRLRIFFASSSFGNTTIMFTTVTLLLLYNLKNQDPSREENLYAVKILIQFPSGNLAGIFCPFFLFRLDITPAGVCSKHLFYQLVLFHFIDCFQKIVRQDINPLFLDLFFCHIENISINSCRRHDLLLDAVQSCCQADCQHQVWICRRIRTTQFYSRALPTFCRNADQRAAAGFMGRQMEQ